MAKSRKNKFSNVFTTAETCNIHNGNIDLKDTMIGIDESTQIFHSTIDHVVFNSMYEIIHKILEAQGFTPNLENLLSTLDSLKFTVHGTQNQKAKENEIIELKTWMPALQFKMPNYQTKGPLLYKFYEEVAHYENELFAFKKKSNTDKDEKEITKKELREEVRKLKEENSLLEDRLKQLSIKFNKVKANMQGLGGSGNLDLDLNLHISSGIIRKVQISQRNIIIKLQNKTVNYPLLLSDKVPETNEKCLVLFENNAIKKVLYLENKGHIPRIRPAKVLFSSNNTCKVRDHMRSVWEFSAKNPEEEKLIARLSRGKLVHIFLLKNQLIKFSVGEYFKIENILMDIQEASVLNQLHKEYIDALIDSKKINKQEVA